MKNATLHPFLLAMLLFLTFLTGILFGRVFPTNVVHLSAANNDSIQSASEDPDPSADIYVKGKLNINTAPSEELTLLPGIGKIIADRIVAYRLENGGFTSVEELKNVKGIGNSIFTRIEQYITIGG